MVPLVPAVTVCAALGVGAATDTVAFGLFVFPFTIARVPVLYKDLRDTTHVRDLTPYVISQRVIIKDNRQRRNRPAQTPTLYSPGESHSYGRCTRSA